MTTVLLPLRWLRHNVDVCAVLGDHDVKWIARDVLEALGYDDLGDFADEPDHHAPYSAEQHKQASAYPFDTVREIVGDSYLGEALIQWMSERENALAAMGHGNVARIASSPALLDGPLYAVARAAQILDTDPAISIGERRLFDWLLAKEWILRRGSEYQPARSAVNDGYLAVVPRRLPHTYDLYPQVVITTAGLVELHRVLGGTDPAVLEQEPA